jgi:intracellular sulfur oxidation DsrE/DsrF family protein
MREKRKQNHFSGLTETLNEKEISEDLCGLCEKEERGTEIRSCLQEEKRMEIDPEDLPDFHEEVDCGVEEMLQVDEAEEKLQADEVQQFQVK